jgi:pilus retraction protein PilT
MDAVFQNILRAAAEAQASDIHLKADGAIVLRIDRKLVTMDAEPPSDEWLRATIEMIAPAHLRERLAAGQEIDFAFAVEGLGRFRTNVFQQRGKTAVALRLVKAQIRGFGELNLPETIRHVAESPRGIVIVAGAIGSGKSTTLAAMLAHVNATARKHIITLEDPIEYLFQDRESLIEQREVGLDTESFSAGLRHVLRQDPDIIVIGEMRDAESAMAAMSAANIGHLVITTLHTSDAMRSVQRVVEFFPAEQRDYARQLFAATLRAVICQRLVASSKSGVIPAVEILINSVGVANAIATDQTDKLPGMMELGSNEGMQTFDQALRALVAANRITREEAMSHAANPDALRMSFQGVTLTESTRILGTRK